MNISGRKNIYPRTGIKNRRNSHINSRRGASALSLLVFAAAFSIASIAFVSARFLPDDASGGFFGHASAIALKTFGNIFSPAEEKPVLEIDLTDSPASEKKSSGKIQFSGTDMAEKNTDALPQNKTAENFYNLIPENKNAAATSSQSGQKPENKISECYFPKIESPNHQIIFSEVNWAGSKESPNDEWIEMKNNSGRDISLGGWQMLSADGNIKIIFGEENKIATGGFYLLERTDDNSAPNAAADYIYSGTLSNSGTDLKLFGSDCSVSDEIIVSGKWPAGDAPLRRTMERSYLDFSWHTGASDNGTPGKENTAAFSKKETEQPQPQSGTENSNQNGSSGSSATQNYQGQNQASGIHILISDIQITGGSGKTTNDFIKIFNPSSVPFNLKGYRLVKRTKSGASDTSLKSWTADALIPSHGYYIWANSSFSSLTPPADTTTSGSISDDNGVALRQGPEDTGIIIDAVAWGGAQNGFAEGSAYPANPGANQILSRKTLSGVPQDTNSNQNDFEMK